MRERTVNIVYSANVLAKCLNVVSKCVAANLGAVTDPSTPNNSTNVGNAVVLEALTAALENVVQSSIQASLCGYLKNLSVVSGCVIHERIDQSTSIRSAIDFAVHLTSDSIEINKAADVIRKTHIVAVQ